MRHSYPAVVVLITLVSGLHAAARTEEAKPCAKQRLPANLDLPRELAEIFEETYDRSSTFRTQCARIAQASNLSVSVQLDGSMRSRCRAFTVVRRRGLQIRACVHLVPSGRMFAELIGHEFEHILEQLEGLNLRALARVKKSGVQEVERELFETERAQRAGRLVADEVNGSRASY